MPFGKWPNFQACIADMQGPPNNYDEETAKKTCGKLQHRLEGKELFKIFKSATGRRVIGQYISVEELDKQNDVVPMHRLRDALDELKQRDPRYLNVMYRHRSYQVGHPLWSFTDEFGEEHHTEVDEYGLWGVTEVRNDGYVMADVIWDMIANAVPMGASIAINPVNAADQPAVLTQDLIKEKGLKQTWLGAKYWDMPLQFIEPWSLTPTPANQYVTAATILAKDVCVPCVEQRAQLYQAKGEAMPDALQHARKFYIAQAAKQRREYANQTTVVTLSPVKSNSSLPTRLRQIDADTRRKLAALLTS